MGLLIGKFLRFLMELSARDMSIFSFQDDNLSKYQWIFTKLDICIDIVETWTGTANGQILSIFDRDLPETHSSLFPDENLSKCQWTFTKLGICIDIVEIRFGITDGQILQFLTELFALNMIMAGYYHFYVFLS